MNALEIEGLSKSFGTSKVLKDLSFSVPEHSVFGFLGQNGAGKTTTMKLILGLLKPDNGIIRVFGRPVSYGETATNQMIGYLPDVPEYYGYMTPLEYLTLCGQVTGLSANDTRKRSHSLLELVGLPVSRKRIGGFSRGMKQRLGIAQALLNQPRLLICDEPTSALDPVGRKEILDILSRVTEHTTVLFSTHILSDVEKICSEAAILHKGSIALEGSLIQLRASHSSSRLLLSFTDASQLQKLLQAEDFAPYRPAASIEELSVSFPVSDTRYASLKLMSLLCRLEIAPIKLEAVEPSLEKLFMEVVQ